MSVGLSFLHQHPLQLMTAKNHLAAQTSALEEGFQDFQEGLLPGGMKPGKGLTVADVSRRHSTKATHLGTNQEY